MTHRKLSLHIFIASLCITISLGILGLPSVAQLGRGGSPISYPLLDNAKYQYLASEGNTSFSGGYDEPFTIRERDVIVNDSIYTSQFHIRATRNNFTKLVTDIDSETFDTLTVQLATPDNAALREQKANITFKQDASVLETYENVPAGHYIDYIFDLRNPNVGNPGAITFQIDCEREVTGAGCIAFFGTAELSRSTPIVTPTSSNTQTQSTSSASSSQPAERETWRNRTPTNRKPESVEPATATDVLNEIWDWIF